MQCSSNPQGDRADPARPQQPPGERPGQRTQAPMPLAEFWKRIDGHA